MRIMLHSPQQFVGIVGGMGAAVVKFAVKHCKNGGKRVEKVEALCYNK